MIQFTAAPAASSELELSVLEDIHELEMLCSTNPMALECVSRLRRKLDVMSDIYGRSTQYTKSEGLGLRFVSQPQQHASGVAPLA